ncbi:hypothetical protein BGZ83_009830 [Gryganskiella cystojenkinii]|nr:hypothetical protein BGZ83_009830 [Gryganskiella cystojenkinii]
MTRTQFHHYIPRFILKTFADNFSLSSSQTVYIAKDALIAFETPIANLSERNNGGKGRGSKKNKGKGGNRGGKGTRGGTGEQGQGHQVETRSPSKQPNYYINVYRFEVHTTTLNDIARCYGLPDMYRDITLDDSMKFEKLLSVMESTSARFIRQIWNGEALALTRTQLVDLKKFLIVMLYRNESRRYQYMEQKFDLMTYLSVKKHTDHNKIERVQDVWFKNLQYLIDTPGDDIVQEYMRSQEADPEGNPFKIFAQYQGPIHVAELIDFALMIMQYVCIWEAEEGSEFILSECCFGVFEGQGGVNFHNFFVVSPRYAIVLVNRHYMLGTMNELPLRKSWFSENLHANPETVYKKGPATTITIEDFDPNDIFKYKRIVVPKKDVYLVNSIFLDCRNKYLTYKSNVSMFRSLLFYDKEKAEKFLYRHDYSVLKRKLWSELNRTHNPAKYASMLTSQSPPISKQPTKSQFHHYIPRFILKTFADNFSLSSTKTVYIRKDTSSISETTRTLPERLSGEGQGFQVETRPSPKDVIYHINIHRVEDYTTTLGDVARSHGSQDMYRDITLDDSMRFERLLALLECTAAWFIRKIWTRDKDLSLTRDQLSEMKKFINIMSYRTLNRVITYVHNSIEHMQEVWFKNLKYLLGTPVKDIMKDHGRASIHLLELRACLFQNTLRIWEVEEGSEFILNEGFGMCEGDQGIKFHHFFLVSPKTMIVLVNREFIWDMRPKGTSSWFGSKLRAMPDTIYKKGRTSDITMGDFDPDDVFKYKRIVVPKKDVYFVNSIHLDHGQKYLTYKCSVSMYKSL